MPESHDVQDQLMFLLSMSPLLLFMDYFDNGIRNPLKKQVNAMQMQAGSVLAATSQLDRIGAPQKMNLTSLFGGLFKKEAKKKPPRPNLPPDYEEALKKHVDKILADNEVVIFSTTTCPYCVVSEETLSSYNVNYKKINLNTYSEMDDEFLMLGPLMHKYVVDITGLRTVPNIVVKKDLIGGNSQLNAKVESGEFKQILDKYEIAHSLA